LTKAAFRNATIGGDLAGRITGMRAKDIMVTEVITVGPQASVRDVAKLLLSNRISALPAVDEHGRLIGIISEGDLASRARHQSSSLVVVGNVFEEKQGGSGEGIFEVAWQQS